MLQPPPMPWPEFVVLGAGLCQQTDRGHRRRSSIEGRQARSAAATRRHARQRQAQLRCAASGLSRLHTEQQHPEKATRPSRRHPSRPGSWQTPSTGLQAQRSPGPGRVVQAPGLAAQQRRQRHHHRRHANEPVVEQRLSAALALAAAWCRSANGRQAHSAPAASPERRPAQLVRPGSACAGRKALRKRQPTA